MKRPCDQGGTNVCIAEGCYGQACITPPPAPETERQVWEKPVVPGTNPRTDQVKARVLLDVDHEGRAYVHEAVLAQLFTEAGWERTA